MDTVKKVKEQKLRKKSRSFLPPIQADHDSCPVWTTSSSQARQHNLNTSIQRHPTKHTNFLPLLSAIHDQTCLPAKSPCHRITHGNNTRVKKEPSEKSHFFLPPIGTKGFHGKDQSHIKCGYITQACHEPAWNTNSTPKSRTTKPRRHLDSIDEPTLHEPHIDLLQDKTPEPDSKLIIKQSEFTQTQLKKSKKKRRSKKYSQQGCSPNNNRDGCKDNYDMRGNYSESPVNQFLYWSTELSAFLRSSARKDRRDATCGALDPFLEDAFERIREIQVRQALEEFGVLSTDWVNFPWHS